MESITREIDFCGMPDQIASSVMQLLPNTTVRTPGSDYYREQAKYALVVVIAALQANKQEINLRVLSDLFVAPVNLRFLANSLALGSDRLQLEMFLNRFCLGSKSRHFDVKLFNMTLGGLIARLWRAAADVDRSVELESSYS